jgi:HAE1 family hydrophobic/amphiphilic exporter-1
VFGGLLIPPGLSVEYREEIAERIEAVVKPYLDADPDDPEAVAALDPIGRMGFGPERAPPALRPGPHGQLLHRRVRVGMFVGGTSAEREVVIPVGQLLTNAIMPIPDTYGGARQTSIFGTGPRRRQRQQRRHRDLRSRPRPRHRGRGDDVRAGRQKYGFTEVRPDPGNFNLQQQEYQVSLNERARELGVRNEDVGTVIRALFDGAFAGEYKLPDRNIDINVVPEGGRLSFKEKLAEIPVATPAGPVVPLDSIIEIVPALAPQDIKRIEELPAVTLQFTPPQGVPVERMQADLEAFVIQPARDAGLIDRTMRINMEGTAAKLNEVQAALFGRRRARGRGPSGLDGAVRADGPRAARGLGRLGLRGRPAQRAGSAGSRPGASSGAGHRGRGRRPAARLRGGAQG